MLLTLKAQVQGHFDTSATLGIAWTFKDVPGMLVISWQVFTGWNVRFSMTECDAQHPPQQGNDSIECHFPVHLHNVNRLCGKGLRHFEGSSLPRCSSHPPCVTGACCVSGSSIFASSLHALCTRKAPLRICPLMTLLVGGRESIPALALV